MRIFITGASGFLGRHLTAKAGREFDILRGSRSKGDIHFDLKDPNEHEGEIAECDVIIHAAWEMHCSNADFVNLNAVDRLLQIASQKKHHFIFISSLAAHDEAESGYGRAKFKAEELVRSYKYSTIIRPGTIVGDGGLFEKMKWALETYPVVPLFDGGKQKIQLIGIEDLTCAILEIARARRFGEFNVAGKDGLELKTIYRTLARHLNAKRWFISLPIVPILYIVKALEKAGIRLPMTSDNLLGLRRIRAFATEDDWRRVWETSPRMLKSTVEYLENCETYDEKTDR